MTKPTTKVELANNLMIKRLEIYINIFTNN